MHTCTLCDKSSCLGAVINAITNRVTGVSAPSLSRSRGEGQVVRVTIPAVVWPRSRRLNPALRLFEHLHWPGLLSRLRAPRLWMVPPCGPCGQGQQWPGCWSKRGVMAQQRPLLLAAALAAGQGGGWWYWLLIFSSKKNHIRLLW